MRPVHIRNTSLLVAWTVGLQPDCPRRCCARRVSVSSTIFNSIASNFRLVMTAVGLLRRSKPAWLDAVYFLALFSIPSMAAALLPSTAILFVGSIGAVTFTSA